MSVLIPLFTALVAAGAFIKIPLGPVPITLQTLFCFLAALLLPAKSSVAAIALYLFLGTLGLPIFTTGGGIAALLAPTGGFLFAMVPAVAVGSLLATRKRDSVLYNVLILVIMDAILYIGGVLFLAWSRDMSLISALIAGCFTFIPGDILKIAIAAIAAKYLYPESEKIRMRKNNMDIE